MKQIFSKTVHGAGIVRGKYAAHDAFQIERVFQRTLAVDECLHIRNSEESEGPSVGIQLRIDDLGCLRRSDDKANEGCS